MQYLQLEPTEHIHSQLKHLHWSIVFVCGIGYMRRQVRPAQHKTARAEFLWGRKLCLGHLDHNHTIDGGSTVATSKGSETRLDRPTKAAKLHPSQNTMH